MFCKTARRILLTVSLCFFIYLNTLLVLTAIVPHHSSCVSSHLSAHIDWDANDHCRDGNAGYESDAHGRAHQRAELPEDLLLSAPGLLAPESAA